MGMLTGAICGNVFASPNAGQVRHAIDRVDNDKGTLIIVKNYTGDVLNFGLAKEQYSAIHPDKAERVKFLIVGDDVAVGKSQGTIVGRRGLAGTVLVYKIAGELADRGASLSEVYNVAKWVSENVVTIGLYPQVPGTAASNLQLDTNEIEIGMGIHNESGHRRVSPVPTLRELLPQLFGLLTAQDDPEHSFLTFTGGDKIVLLVNNLGGLSELELGGIAAQARETAENQGFQIERLLKGTFMTSLNMPGFSITILRLPHESSTEGVPSRQLILSLLDARPDAPGWPWSAGASPTPLATQLQTISAEDTTSTSDDHIKLQAVEESLFSAAIERACKALISAESEFTQMDNIAGDGDCGLTLKAGAEGVLAELSKGNLKGSDVVGSVIAIAKVAEEAMGGTSGALYSIFFSALAQGLQSQSLQDGSIVTPQIWSQALDYALAKLYQYTRARPPSRTLVDPLAAFVSTFSKSSGFDYVDAVKAAAEAADKTKDIEAKAGRSAYVEGDILRKQRIPDPGAWGVKVILEGLQN
ncbi:hypothetical protein AX16_001728 [Volvariella volvacea WC 439]|nr:hypothetical protein AX16_001728 [Volvariella volvacea WC 439]